MRVHCLANHIDRTESVLETTSRYHRELVLPRRQVDHAELPFNVGDRRVDLVLSADAKCDDQGLPDVTPLPTIPQPPLDRACPRRAMITPNRHGDSLLEFNLNARRQGPTPRWEPSLVRPLNPQRCRTLRRRLVGVLLPPHYALPIGAVLDGPSKRPVELPLRPCRSLSPLSPFAVGKARDVPPLRNHNPLRRHAPDSVAPPACKATLEPLPVGGPDAEGWSLPDAMRFTPRLTPFVDAANDCACRSSRRALPAHQLLYFGVGQSAWARRAMTARPDEQS